MTESMKSAVFIERVGEWSFFTFQPTLRISLMKKKKIILIRIMWINITAACGLRHVEPIAVETF